MGLVALLAKPDATCQASMQALCTVETFCCRALKVHDEKLSSTNKKGSLTALKSMNKETQLSFLSS